MTKIKIILMGLTGLMMVSVLPLAHAQTPQEDPNKMHSKQWVQDIFAELNLTEDQKKQLEMNKERHRSKMEIARQQIKLNKEALRAELMKTQLDMSKIKEFHNRIKALQDGMEDDKLNSILAVRGILTPDQFTKFVELMHKHRITSEK